MRSTAIALGIGSGLAFAALAAAQAPPTAPPPAAAPGASPPAVAPSAAAAAAPPAASPDGGAPAATTPAPPKLVEAYNGVTPASTALSPLPPPNLATWGSKLIWQGFRMTESGSQVFFQVAGPIEYELKPTKSQLVVKLRNTKVHLKNNGRELETRYFATPIRRVTTRRMRKDVEVHIGLKEPVTGTPRIDVGPEGTQFLVIDFPPGKAEQVPGQSDIGVEGGGVGRARGPAPPVYSNGPDAPKHPPAGEGAGAPGPSQTLPPPL